MQAYNKRDLTLIHIILRSLLKDIYRVEIPLIYVYDNQQRLNDLARPTRLRIMIKLQSSLILGHGS